MSNADDRALKADELRASFGRMQQHILDNPMLSEEGKHEQIAAVREQTNAKIRALQDEASAALEAERQRLERLLFSPPRPLSAATTSVSDRIAQDASYRDALDRARRTDPGQPESLRELLEQAQRTSDDLQSRAAMVIAFERGNVDVINAWSSANPSYERDVDRFYELSQRTDRSHGLREVVAEAFDFMTV